MAKAPLMFTLAVPFMDSFGLMEWMRTSKSKRLRLHCLFSLCIALGILLIVFVPFPAMFFPSALRLFQI